MIRIATIRNKVLATILGEPANATAKDQAWIQAATLATDSRRNRPTTARICLLVDDDRRIRDLLSRFLCGEGYRVTTAMSASDARAKLLGLHFDLLILDVMMPGETGFDLARFIRPRPRAIIMLTARHEAEPASRACRSAADDYVAKPFEAARAGLADRQYPQAHRAAAAVETLEQVAFGPTSTTSTGPNCARGEEIVHLTDREREMLRILACAPGETVRAARSPGRLVNERASTCRSNRLRRQDEKDPANPLFLQAVRGVGYRLGRFPLSPLQ